MNRRHFKSLLPSLVLLVGLVALTSIHLRTRNSLNDSLRESRAQVYALEERNETDRREMLTRTGYLNVEDPDKGYVRRLGATDGMVWQYRVYVPQDAKYMLYAGQAGGRAVSRLPNGDPDGFVLTLVFRRVADELHYVLVGPGFEGGGVIEGQGPWTNERSEPSAQSVINPVGGCVLFSNGHDAFSLHPFAPFGLFSPMTASRFPFRVWISPVPSLRRGGDSP